MQTRSDYKVLYDCIMCVKCRQMSTREIEDSRSGSVYNLQQKKGFSQLNYRL